LTSAGTSSAHGPRGQGVGAFGIGKGEGVVEADLPQGVQDVGELGFAFAAKADQDIGGDRHPRQSSAQ